MLNQIGKFILSILLALFLVPTFRRSPSPFWYWAWYMLLVIFCVSGTGGFAPRPALSSLLASY